MAELVGSVSTSTLYSTAFFNDLHTTSLPPNTDPGLLIHPMNNITCNLVSGATGAVLSDCMNVSTSLSASVAGSIQVQVNSAVTGIQVLTDTVSLHVWAPVEVCPTTNDR